MADEGDARGGGDQREQVNTTSTTASNVARGIRSMFSRQQDQPQRASRNDESTPLLARDYTDDEEDNASDASEGPDDSLITERRRSSTHSTKKTKKRRGTIISLVLLCLAALVILGLGFAAPEAMQEYAEQSAVFEPTKLALQNFTTHGVNARVQGNFYMDETRVKRNPVRSIGKALTWIAGAVETKDTQVTLSLPEYDIELGTAQIPPVVVSIRVMEKTPIDVVVKVVPGDVGGLKDVALDWAEGRLGQIRLKGKAHVPLKSGIFPLGTHAIAQTLTFAGDQIPAIPKYDISKINVHEIDLPGGSTGLSADVSISAYNEYPVSFVVPPLAFEISIPGCSADGPYIHLANATTQSIVIEPESQVTVLASGTVTQLSDRVISTCPGTDSSPLDTIVGNYLSGEKATMYVQGSHAPLEDTPQWIAELLQSMQVPVPVSGHSVDNLIRNFSMEDTHFSFPNPLADPESPEAQPRISTNILVLANLPEEMNFPIKVSRVRSIANVSYEGEDFGYLELQKWQKATSHRVDGQNGDPPALAVQASIKDAPLSITDRDVFTDVIQGVLLGDDISLGVKASVDIEVTTALGTFAIRDVPAEGKVPLQPLVGDGLMKQFAPSIGNLEIIETSPHTFRLAAIANATNPTNYSASLPYVNINLLYNGTILGNVSMEEIKIRPGNNTNLSFAVFWDPHGLSGINGSSIARELISRQVSGYNTSITLRAHDATFPSNPRLGSALANLEFTVQTPRLGRPSHPHDPDDDDDDDDGPRFIDDATMHLISSTADFTLLSPFRQTTLYLTSINATALYNRTEPVGTIQYDLPIAVNPGKTKTPRLPVDWDLGSVGYDAVKDALGGTLKLAAKANVTVRIGQWVETVHFEGAGIGAHIQL